MARLSVVLLLGCILIVCSQDAFAAPKRYSTNNPRVAELYELAEKGDPDAQFELGTIFQDGEIVPQNDAEAIKWITMAANNGNTDAMINLGVVYRGGFNGETLDKIEAYKWFDIALALDNDKGFLLRNNVAQKMTLEEIDAAKQRSRMWQRAHR